jgi:hypothetical protein
MQSTTIRSLAAARSVHALRAAGIVLALLAGGS